MLMELLDSITVTLCATFLGMTTRFFYLAWKTKDSHPDDPIVQQHFMEHSVAAAFAFAASLLGTIWSAAHMVSPQQSMHVELPLQIIVNLLIVSSILFMWHMVKEQTPGHPYYIRENGEDL